MAFIDARLPENVEQGAQGGPGFKTTVMTLASGYEKRNMIWESAKGRYDVGYGIQSKDDFSEVLAFFYVCKGRGNSFRFKDWADYELTSELIGTGDGVEDTFQITKTYTVGAYTYVRDITKPVTSGFQVYVAGVLKTVTTHYSISGTTGLIVFTGGNIPAMGETVRVTGEFDVPVRFDVDDMGVTLSIFNAGAIPNIPLVEVRGE